VVWIYRFAVLLSGLPIVAMLINGLAWYWSHDPSWLDRNLNAAGLAILTLPIGFLVHCAYRSEARFVGVPETILKRKSHPLLLLQLGTLPALALLDHGFHQIPWAALIQVINNSDQPLTQVTLELGPQRFSFDRIAPNQQRFRRLTTIEPGPLTVSAQHASELLSGTDPFPEGVVPSPQFSPILQLSLDVHLDADSGPRLTPDLYYDSSP
jgi:hypothetical protein